MKEQLHNITMIHIGGKVLYGVDLKYAEGVIDTHYPHLSGVARLNAVNCFAAMLDAGLEVEIIPEIDPSRGFVEYEPGKIKTPYGKRFSIKRCPDGHITNLERLPDYKKPHVERFVVYSHVREKKESSC